MFNNAGKNRIRDLFYNDVSYGMLGSDGTAPLATDTALLSADASTSSATSAQAADKQVVVDYNLGSMSAVGSTFSEFGVFNADDTMFARVVFADLTHASTEQWQFSTRFFID